MEVPQRATGRPYRPPYSEPSASIAPYGPTDAATNAAARWAIPPYPEPASAASPPTGEAAFGLHPPDTHARPKPSNVAW